MSKLGKWITNNTDKPFYARRTINIKKEIQSATAKVCGLGQFIFWVNGEKIGDHELDPGWTNYNKYIQYVVFDITGNLVKGKNVIGAEVGNGWFIKEDVHYTFQFPEFMPPNPNPYRAFGESLVLALELELVFKDGSKETITADENYRVCRHPVVMSNVYGSETFDGRLEIPKWCSCEYDDREWQTAIVVEKDMEPKGELAEQFQPAIKVIQTYEGKKLYHQNGKTIYDFGQNMSGILEFEVRGNVGEEIKVYPAEKLDKNGNVDQMAKGWTMVDSCITYIIKENNVWEHFRMKFTYFAGRYIAVEGGELRNVKGHAISSAHKTDGEFRCDDKRFEQIYLLVEKAVEANMVSVHTDCPTIERFAWQEPNHLMAPAIMYMKNGNELWRKFLLDMRVDQHKAEDYFLDYEGNKVYVGTGLMPSQCPCYLPNVLPVPGMGSFYDIIPWGSTCILGTYWHYMFYGDLTIIEENYDAGMRYLTYLKSKVNDEGFINHGLGDWGNPKQELLRENIETVFLYADAMTLAYFAKLLGKEDDVKILENYGQEIKRNYNEKLLVYDEEKGFYCYKAWNHPNEIHMTQASQALPLYWGMVPMEHEEDIVKAFRYTLEREQAFISGEVGLPYVIQCASRYGMNRLVEQFIIRETHPSYYAFVLDGETTLGEYWETNPRSHCHDMMGHIIEWYYNGIAGIIPTKPGFKEVVIKPYLPQDMHEFVCSYRSVNGEIRVNVREKEYEVIVDIQVPKNVKAEIDTSELLIKEKDIFVFRNNEVLQ